MKNAPIPENPARVLALTLGGWAGGVAWASADGVLARLDPGAAAALAAFAALYAVGTYLLDGGIRAFLHRASRAQWLAIAAGADVLLAVAVTAALAHADGLAAFTHGPLALAAYVGIPLAAVAHLAALAAPAAARLRSPAGGSPGAKPAAP